MGFPSLSISSSLDPAGTGRRFDFLHGRFKVTVVTKTMIASAVALLTPCTRMMNESAFVFNAHLALFKPVFSTIVVIIDIVALIVQYRVSVGARYLGIGPAFHFAWYLGIGRQRLWLQPPYAATPLDFTFIPRRHKCWTGVAVVNETSNASIKNDGARQECHHRRYARRCDYVD
jgi:hypothetical protein